MTVRPRVAILLATFHPNEFIIHQIDSFRKQYDVDVKIFWGDDGSTEKEKLVVRNLLSDFKYDSFTFENVGATRNFIELLKNAADFDFYAFSDQDDIWLPEKLITSINCLDGCDIPALCHSNVTVLKNDFYEDKRVTCQDHSMKTLVAENCFQGCTMVFNARLRELFLSFSTDDIFWHDWWLGWLASSAGAVFTLDQSLTIYRIHDRNSIGLPNKGQMIARFFHRKSGISFEQAKLFRDRYIGIISEESLSELNSWIKIYSKSRAFRIVSLLCDTKRRSGPLDDALRRISSILKIP